MSVSMDTSIKHARLREWVVAVSACTLFAVMCVLALLLTGCAHRPQGYALQAPAFHECLDSNGAYSEAACAGKAVRP